MENPSVVAHFKTQFLNFLRTLHKKFPKHQNIQVYLNNNEHLNIEKLMHAFRENTACVTKRILARDETLFSSSESQEWFRGIDMSALFDTLEESERESFWVYSNLFVLLTNKKDRKLVDSIKSDLETNKTDVNDENQDMDAILQDALKEAGLEQMFQSAKPAMAEMFETVCEQISNDELSMENEDLKKVLPPGQTTELFQEMLKDVTKEIKRTKANKNGEKMGINDLFNPDTICRLGQKYSEKLESGDLDLSGLMSGIMKQAQTMTGQDSAMSTMAATMAQNLANSMESGSSTDGKPNMPNMAGLVNMLSTMQSN